MHPPRAAAWALARVGEPSFYRTIMLRRRIEQALAQLLRPDFLSHALR